MNGVHSKTQIVGPRLFKIYVNGLLSKVVEGRLYMFADDTTIYVIADDIEELINGLNSIAQDIHRWCTENKLTVHLDKTEAMIIAYRPFIGPLRPIQFGNNNIKIVTKLKSLGVVINNKLNWKEQRQKVAKSYSAKLSQLKRMKYPSSVLEEIYYKSIVANVTYGILIWGTCYPPQLQVLEHYHVRAAKYYNIQHLRR